MKILMVCLGNICRSPMAEGIMKKLLADHNIPDWDVDSAGIGSWHAGDLPDHRAIKTSLFHGIDISDQRARQIKKGDFEYYDHILVMDHENLLETKRLTYKKHYHKIHLLLDFKFPDKNQIVPDPYFSNENSGQFENCFQLIYQGCEAFIRSWKLEVGS